jgi:hypothetical protein
MILRFNILFSNSTLEFQQLGVILFFLYLQSVQFYDFETIPVRLIMNESLIFVDKVFDEMF